jgi:general secretion pathway protein B
MSFILDALRKSEAERQRDDAPSLSQVPLATLPRGTPSWTWIVIGILTLALAGLALALWRTSGEGPAATLASTNAAEPSAPAARTTERLAAPELAPAPAPADTASGAGEDPAPVLASEPRPIRELAALAPALPEFRLEFLAFDPQDSARSSAWINGTVYRIGEQISGGPELTEIRADSVVLRYRGESFVLRTR